MKITDKIRAGAFARGLVHSLDASDEVCEAAIRGFFVASGREVPSDDQLVKAFCGPAERNCGPNESSDSRNCGPQESRCGSGGHKTDDRQPEPKPDGQATADERKRVRDLMAKATLFGVDQAAIDAAIDSGRSVEHWVMQWSDRLAEREGRGIVDSRDDVFRAGPAEADKFVAEGTAVLGSKMNLGNIDRKLLQQSTMRNFSSIEVARSALMVNGIRPSGDKEQDALKFLQLGGSERRILISGEGGPVDGPGNHPDLLSNLTGKILEQGYATAECHYAKWTERLQDMSDFKPKVILEMGIFGELDATGDDEELLEKKFASNAVGWIKQGRYRNGSSLTVVMIANDELDGFGKQMMSYPGAADRTLNSLCLNILVGNHAMLDGSVLFHTSNLNDIDPGQGGVPSNTQAAKMRRLHRLQKNPGPEGTHVPINIPPSIALLPAEHEDDGLKTFMRNMQDSKEANTDSEINTVRGTIMPYFDSYLDEFSTTRWFTFIDPRIHAAIAHAFFTGFGAGGRRETWFDNNRAVRKFSFEARFAACAKSRRGICRNPGN